MPSVDFTKDELLKDVRVIVREIVRDDVGTLIDERLDVRFAQEREYTRGMLDERFTQEREYTRQMMADTFMSFWDSNFKPAFDSLEAKYEAHDRLLALHSMDIMELRALNV